MRAREIKFRAWDKHEKEMFEWGEMLTSNNPAAWFTGHLKTVTLMQATGIKDVNGKEIYEGDILSLWYSRDTTGKDIVRFNHTVVWEDTNGFSGWNIPFLESAEIIGNVFAHPELAD